MISIYFFNKLAVFIGSFLIGVIIIFVSLIQINEAYANVENREDIYISSIVPFYWMIMLIGGVIMVTLSYVSWRKYRGHKKNKRKRDANN